MQKVIRVPANLNPFESQVLSGCKKIDMIIFELTKKDKQFPMNVV